MRSFSNMCVTEMEAITEPSLNFLNVVFFLLSTISTSTRRRKPQQPKADPSQFLRPPEGFSVAAV